jgi:hypothetical protein
METIQKLIERAFLAGRSQTSWEQFNNENLNEMETIKSTLDAIRPILIEVNEQWGNGEDCYSSALELFEKINLI